MASITRGWSRPPGSATTNSVAVPMRQRAAPGSTRYQDQLIRPSTVRPPSRKATVPKSDWYNSAW